METIMCLSNERRLSICPQERDCVVQNSFYVKILQDVFSRVVKLFPKQTWHERFLYYILMNFMLYFAKMIYWIGLERSRSLINLSWS
jgi:hypothetical protein